jgi:predicted hotdog family 3-hydroxylacyl-ACP dehydratase
VTDHDRVRPVLGDLEGFTWSTEESVAYEAAIEAISGAVGAYTALIHAEESKPVPDPAVIAAARSGRVECARRRKELDPADPVAVAATRRRFADLAREISQGPDA